MNNRTGASNNGRGLRRLLVGALCVPVVVGALAVGAAGLPGGGADRATAELVDTAGMSVGTAKLVEDASGRMHVNVHVRGLTPGSHGIHIHNTASCASGATAFSGAGSHHNPGATTHGTHSGDLPNLVVNVAGVGHLDATADSFTLGEGPNSIFDANGSALVIHAAEDDLVTDPTGNSGARVACGVIVAG